MKNLVQSYRQYKDADTFDAIKYRYFIERILVRE